jgi:hypothetical protein
MVGYQVNGPAWQNVQRTRESLQDTLKGCNGHDNSQEPYVV